jgi:hypothetical protein
MPTSLDDPKYWQRRAEETRSLADQWNDFAGKAVMLRIAIEYDRLAVHTANRLKQAALQG